MLEFKINDYITLKLEEVEEKKETNIYILGEKFIQCKYLLINFPVQDVEQYDEINSIDEASENLAKSLERGNPEAFKIDIPPRVEFWGHCSNLQVWAEQDYDTRFIHSNLAFPLLKKLTEVGDQKARRIFKDEIGKRFEMGPDSVRQFLALEGYMDFLSKEEMWSVIPNQVEVKILRSIEMETEAEFKLYSNEIEGFLWGENPNQLAFSIKDDYIMEIDFLNFKTLSPLKWQKIFVLLGKLTALRWLYLSRSNLKTIPDDIKHLKSLEVLKLDHNELDEVPQAICDLDKLEWLILNNNKIKTLSGSVGRLKSLKELHLNDNKLKELPDSIGNLKSLNRLFLANNCLKILPDTMVEMESLTQLLLSNNLFLSFPENIVNMKSLKGVNLKNNNINESSPVIDILEKKGVIILI